MPCWIGDEIRTANHVVLEIDAPGQCRKDVMGLNSIAISGRPINIQGDVVDGTIGEALKESGTSVQRQQHTETPNTEELAPR